MACAFVAPISTPMKPAKKGTFGTTAAREGKTCQQSRPLRDSLAIASEKVTEEEFLAMAASIQMTGGAGSPAKLFPGSSPSLAVSDSEVPSSP